MKRVLKNISKASFTTNSHGKIYSIASKGLLTIDDSQADKIAAELLQRFGFLKDITPKEAPIVETKVVVEPNQKGRMVKKVKKVVRQGKGVKKS